MLRTSMLSDKEKVINDTKLKAGDVDWMALRTRSLQPGGFGKERSEIWPRLLNISKNELSVTEKKSSNDDPLDEPPPIHQDERQIGLDTDRSFVLYPLDSVNDRETLQAELNALLVSLFRRRPRLSYFQGYHDIVTVFFLTLPEEIQLACVEKLSLHRLRDSMGIGLEPVLGLLRVTKNLLRLTDQEYAQVLEQSSPLPFYALSNLLTLFSHDVPTLSLIQHIFDYLLCRPPIATVYLATAVILSRKEDVLQLHEEDEEGMIHSLLSSLPPLSESLASAQNGNASPDSPFNSRSDPDDISNTTFFKAEYIDGLPTTTIIEEQIKPQPETTMTSIQDTSERDGAKIHEDQLFTKYEDLRNETGIPDGTEEKDRAVTHANSGPDKVSSLCDRGPEPPIVSSTEPDTPRSPSLRSRSTSPTTTAKISPANRLQSTSEVNVTSHINAVETKQVSGSLSAETHIEDTPIAKDEEQPAGILLANLLKHADALYADFPPSHSGLHLSSIMGPQSVIFTWSESFSELPADSEAEAMVQHPELVVYPYVDIDEKEDAEGTSASEDEKTASSGLWGIRRRKGKEKVDQTKGGSGKASAKRRRKKLRKSPFSHMEKRTMVAGTVLVLGVAVAIYGAKMRNGNSGGMFLSFADAHGHASTQTKDWKRVGGWVAGALATMSEKIAHGLSNGS